jgi:hypothetical protein
MGSGQWVVGSEERMIIGDKGTGVRVSSFDIRHCFVIRHSDFVIPASRISIYRFLSPVPSVADFRIMPVLRKLSSFAKLQTILHQADYPIGVCASIMPAEKAA